MQSLLPQQVLPFFPLLPCLYWHVPLLLQNKPLPQFLLLLQRLPLHLLPAGATVSPCAVRAWPPSPAAPRTTAIRIALRRVPVIPSRFVS